MEEAARRVVDDILLVEAQSVNEFLRTRYTTSHEHLARSSQRCGWEEIEDAVLFFAFRVERMFKGIARDINPMFAYESDCLNNSLSVLFLAVKMISAKQLLRLQTTFASDFVLDHSKFS